MEAQEAAQSISEGTHYFLGKDTFDRKQLVEKYGTPGQEAISAVEGLARGASYGLSDIAASALSSKEAVEGRRSVNEDLADVSEAAGFVGAIAAPSPLAVSKLGGLGKFLSKKGVSKIAVTPVGMFDQLAAKTGTALSKNLNKKISRTLVNSGMKKGTQKTLKAVSKPVVTGANMATQAIIDSSAMLTGNEITDVALGNKDFIAEDYGSRMIQNAFDMGKMGFALGAGGSVAYNTIRKTTEKAFKNIHKFADKAVKVDATKYEVDPKLTELKMVPQKTKAMTKKPGVWMKLDDDKASLVYEDSNRILYFDKTDMELFETGQRFAGKRAHQIVDIENPDSVRSLGGFVGVDNLDKYIDIGTVKTHGFRKALEDAIVFTTQRPSPQTLAVMARSKKKAIQEAAENFRKRENIVNTVKAQGSIPSNRLGDKRRINAKLNELYDALRNEPKRYKYLNKTGMKTSEVAEKMKLIDDYVMAYKKGDEFFVTNIDKVKNVSIDGYLKAKGKLTGKNIPGHVSSALKWAGAQKKHFREFSSERMHRLARFIKDNSKSTIAEESILGGLPGIKQTIGKIPVGSFDNFVENTQLVLQKAGMGIEDSIVAAENVLLKNGMSSNLRWKELADLIQTKYISKTINPDTGIVRPNMQKFHDFLQAQKQEYMRQVRPSGPGSESFGAIPLHELKRIREGLDETVQGHFGDAARIASSTPMKFAKDLRFDLEKKIMDQIEEVPGGSSILDNYIDQKQLYSVAKDAEQLIKNEIAKSSANNKIPLTAYISAGAGASIAGLPGAAAMVLGRKVAAEQGDYWWSMLSEKMAKDTLSYHRKIDKSIGGFLIGTGRVGGLVTVKLKVDENLQKQYDIDKKKMENLFKGMESSIDEYDENNAVVMDTMPEMHQEIFLKSTQMSEFLINKFPKNPNPEVEYSKWYPSDDQILTFQRYKNATFFPKTILDNIEIGYVSAEELEVLNTIHTELLGKLQEGFIGKYKGQPLDYGRRLMVKTVFGINLDNTMNPEAIRMLQSNMLGMNQQQAAEEEQGKTQTPARTRQSSGDFSGQRKTENARIMNK